VVINSSCISVIAYLPTGCNDEAVRILFDDDECFNEEQFMQSRKRNKTS
jgi:hypothetical protein